jgi:hydrogenase-1 operon protein HyaE
MDHWIATPAAMAALHPTLARLVAETGASILDPGTFDAWVNRPGIAMVVFAEQPERFRETLDLAAIVPELYATAGRRFRVGLLPPAAARALAPRFGFARWPAFVMLRNGRCLGAVDGFGDQDVCVGRLARLLAAAPSQPPALGVAVEAAGNAEPRARR